MTTINTDKETLVISTPRLSRLSSQKTTIWVKFTRPGIHCYLKAPDEVKYLRDPHRHSFHFKVGIQVHHDDREIEFHMFLNWVTGLYDKSMLMLDYKSCEMIAAELVGAIASKYDCSNRSIEVEVSEDGECGACVYDNPVGIY